MAPGNLKQFPSLVEMQGYIRIFTTSKQQQIDGAVDSETSRVQGCRVQHSVRSANSGRLNGVNASTTAGGATSDR